MGVKKSITITVPREVAFTVRLALIEWQKTLNPPYPDKTPESLIRAWQDKSRGLAVIISQLPNHPL